MSRIAYLHERIEEMYRELAMVNAIYRHTGIEPTHCWPPGALAGIITFFLNKREDVLELLRLLPPKQGIYASDTNIYTFSTIHPSSDVVEVAPVWITCPVTESIAPSFEIRWYTLWDQCDHNAVRVEVPFSFFKDMVVSSAFNEKRKVFIKGLAKRGGDYMTISCASSDEQWQWLCDILNIKNEVTWQRKSRSELSTPQLRQVNEHSL